jgi:hypothetical protein
MTFNFFRDVFEKCASLRDLNLAANLFRHFPHAALKPAGDSLQVLLADPLLADFEDSSKSPFNEMYYKRTITGQDCSIFHLRHTFHLVACTYVICTLFYNVIKTLHPG